MNFLHCFLIMGGKSRLRKLSNCSSFERVTKRKTLENANEEIIEVLQAKTLLVFFTENQPFALKKNSFVKLIPGLGRYN